MDVLDLFSRTFLPLAAEAGIPITTMSRHLTLFRRYADPQEPTMLVARCSPAMWSASGRNHLILITRRHLVVTRESRVLHRPRLHLAAALVDLQGVTWCTDFDSRVVELAISTASRRERFRLRSSQLRQMWRLESALGRVFRAQPVPSQIATAATTAMSAARAG